ncbi:MAG: divergent PAP2 family protein [Chloroflexi bacterium]|nr:divergent PAP2 family protein [Chloroflexota bacterium]MBV9599453.1 divergent PAP2 family protein [Chloroflexota bacterium]
MDALIANDVLGACIVAWLVAQFSKPLLHYAHTRRLNFRYLVTAGGMPSSHSAVVVALATRVGVDTGLSSILFALSVVFAAVVMYDAAGVRRAVSVQARILNRMLAEMIEAQHFNEERLRELVGHTPFEVFVGALIGALSAVSLR